MWAGNGWFFEREDFQECTVNFWVVFSEKHTAFCQFGWCHFPVNSKEYEIWHLTIHTHTYSKLDVNPDTWLEHHVLRLVQHWLLVLRCWWISASIYVHIPDSSSASNAAVRQSLQNQRQRDKETVDSTPYSFLLQLTLYSIKPLQIIIT